MTIPDRVAISAREEEVLAALEEHLTNAQIARQMHISVRTVESHVSSLLRKLGAVDRRALAALAADHRTPREPPVVHGLPGRWTSFVGREGVVDEIAERLDHDRLVTLVGPGGMGKTRLAIVVADRTAGSFDGGGAFVDLVPVSADFVVQSTAAALGVVEQPGEPLARAVHERLALGRVLLVLDNCEHVLDPVAAFVTDALSQCPGLVVLATSRERLGIPGEQVIAVPPLTATNPGGTEGLSEAEALFIDRARSAGLVEADPKLVSEICEHLDGIPLAIELAAARSASLGADGLVTGLDDHLRLLTSARGLVGRHRSLRAVIDWSHDLLADDEREAFRRLSTFAGSFDLAAVAAVATDGDAFAAGDVVARLTDKSLLVHGLDTGGSRWHMLATMRAYAGEQLDASGELQETRRRHLTWALRTARGIEQALDDDGRWRSQFDAVADDLRAARADADAQGGRGDDGFELACALGHLTYARRFLVEAHEHYASAVRLAPDDGAAVEALRDAAAAALAELRGEVAFELLISASGRAHEAADDRSAAVALADAATIAGRMPASFEHRLTSEAVEGLVAEARAIAPADDVDVVARVTLATAFAGFCGPAGIDPAVADKALVLARQLDDPVLVSAALDAVALAKTAAGDHDMASILTGERVALLDRLPRHDPRSGGEVADIYYSGSQAAIAVGRLDLAVANGRRAYEDSVNRQGLTHFAAAHLVVPFMLQGAFDEALVHAAVMQRGWERTGRPVAGWMATSFYGAAVVCALRGDDASHRQWWDLAEHLSVNSQSSRSFRHFARTRIAVHRGERGSCAALIEPPPTSNAPHFDAYASALGAEAAVVAQRSDADEWIAAALPLTRHNAYAAAYLARAAGRLRGSEDDLERAVALWDAMDARFEVACTLVLMRGRAAEGRRALDSLGCVEVDP